MHDGLYVCGNSSHHALCSGIQSSQTLRSETSQIETWIKRL